MRVGVIGWQRQETNPELVQAWRAEGIDAASVSPAIALRELRAGDVAVGRLDVLPTLDGVEPGLDVLDMLARRGIIVLNSAAALMRVHDKLQTADALRRACLPHPATALIDTTRASVALTPPLVMKPRFGSWGADVFRCQDEAELRRCLIEIRTRPWFTRHGVLVQELVPPRFYDLRVIVAGGRVVGAARRCAAAGEWRTNVSLGGTLLNTRVDRAAGRLAIAAAAAIKMDFVGVDLLPTDRGYVVLELNGAVEFDQRYSLPCGDVYRDAAAALGISRAQSAEMSAT